jgi:putative sterol carrier protein
MDLQKSLGKIATKIAGSKHLRVGTIVLRFTGKDAGDYFVHCKPNGADMVKEQPPGILHGELIGASTTIVPILQGTKDPIPAFLAGGFRVRGDLRYLYDVAYELGILKRPL